MAILSLLNTTKKLPILEDQFPPVFTFITTPNCIINIHGFNLESFDDFTHFRVVIYGRLPVL